MLDRSLRRSIIPLSGSGLPDLRETAAQSSEVGRQEACPMQKNNSMPARCIGRLIRAADVKEGDFSRKTARVGRRRIVLVLQEHGG